MNSVKPGFKIYSFGCKANQYDGQNIREKLIAAGLRESAAHERAGVCVINTCTVTAKADKESQYQMRRCRRDNPGAKIVVTGCMVSRGEKLDAEVDCFITNSDKGRFVDILAKKGTVLRTVPKEGITYFKGHTRAFLKIQDGCDNFCAYCKVPFVRGTPQSKPLEAVRSEALSLTRSGYKEIVLTGICLGKYAQDIPKADLVDAIEALESLGGLARVRLSSIEVGHVTPRLIAKLKEGKKLCPHLHIPLQSGDDTILKAMRRPYTADKFKRLVMKLNESVDKFSLTTDVMVGFPGETDGNFQNTLRLVALLQPLKVHIFPFSPRPGTKAATMRGAISTDEIRARVNCLEEVSCRAADAFRNKFLGKRMEVLVEGGVKHQPGFWQGYTRNYLEVRLCAENDLTNTLSMATVA